jgi:plastocyanin domain-containing protein
MFSKNITNNEKTANVEKEKCPISDINNVNIIDGKQIIEINVKGGYSPQKSFAQAGIPTLLLFNTNGTFDCSASVRIPSMNISKLLPQTGKTEIDIGTPIAETFKGSCGMGMYPFEIEFK